MNSDTPKVYPRNDHCVSRADIDTDALKIMYRLVRHGYKAYLVGGGVRDLLLGKKPKDFDIATDATPRKIKNLFRNCRIIGRRFKLAHVYFRNQKIIEVSTFRDVSTTPSQDALEAPEAIETNAHDNTYGTPATDAHRRDLTINALFYELSTFSIIDYVGGMQDLQSKTIRIIGDPEVRFQEDPVRMLRAVRHAARAGFEIEKQSYKAITKHHELLTTASQVRVYEEFKRDLSGGAALPTLRLLQQTGLLEHLLPELLLNNSALLLKDSYFSTVVERMDSYLRCTKIDEPLTSILGLFAIFLVAYPSSEEQLFEQELDREELIDHLKSCFIKLLVPRKERERIDDLLALWLRLRQMPIERVKKLSLERRKSIRNLEHLLHWLGNDGAEGKLLELVSQAAQAREKGGGVRTRSRPQKGKKRSSTKRGRSS